MLLLWTAGLALAGDGDRAIAGCDTTFTTPDLLAAADSADARFVALDAAGFTTARATLEARLTCTTDTLDGSTMGRVHRVEALGAFIDGKPERVPQALAGLIAADPGHQLPPELVPVGHPIRAALSPATALLREDVGVPMPKLATGWIEVDTAAKPTAPGSRAAVLQQIDSQGVVVASRYRWPEDNDFSWLVVPKESVVGAKSAEPKAAPSASSSTAKVDRPPSPWAHRAPLLGLAVASLGTSGVLFALANQQHAAFEGQPIMSADESAEDQAAYRTELEGMQASANGLSIGWIAAGGVGLGLGVVTVVTW